MPRREWGCNIKQRFFEISNTQLPISNECPIFNSQIWTFKNLLEIGYWKLGIMKKLIYSLGIVILAIFLYVVLSGRLILPQTFSLGPIVIHYYGIIMALAVGSGYYWAKKRAAKYSIDAKTADDIIFWLIVGGFIGARLYHVLSSFDYYRSYPIEIFKVWNGGLSIYGAVIGGCLALLIYQRFPEDRLLGEPQKTVFFRLLDWLTPSVILGQIVGRFGNLFNYEAFGYPTSLPWKMFVPFGFRPEGYLNFDFFHPWFLYEQVGLLIIFYAINRLGKRQVDPRSSATPMPGIIKEQASLFFYYLLLYNILRFGLEFLRIDSTFIGSFRLNSLSSLILTVIATYFIVRRKKLESV